MTSCLLLEGWARRLLWSWYKWHSKAWLAAGSEEQLPPNPWSLRMSALWYAWNPQFILELSCYSLITGMFHFKSVDGMSLCSSLSNVPLLRSILLFLLVFFTSCRQFLFQGRCFTRGDDCLRILLEHAVFVHVGCAFIHTQVPWEKPCYELRACIG